MTATTTRLPRQGTRDLGRRLAGGRTGRRWVRLYHAHEGELDWMLAVDPQMRDHVRAALEHLGTVGACGPVDDATIAAASRVLDDVDRWGGIELRSIVAGLRDELALARGRRLQDVLADR